MQSADLLFLTSDTEGLPGVVLEAAFFGVPTITSRVGGVSECIDDGESGFIVPLWAKAEFLARAFLLLKDDERRRQMGERAREKVLKEFTVETVVSKYYKFFSEITSTS